MRACPNIIFETSIVTARPENRTHAERDARYDNDRGHGLELGQHEKGGLPATAIAQSTEI